MEKGMYDIVKGALLGSTALLLVLVSPLIAKPEPAKQQPPAQSSATVKVDNGWKEFYSTSGNCSMRFPVKPEHFSEKMAVPEEGYELRYDAYISSADQQTVFMLLIAQYPDFVDETYAQMSLESFLNGILRHNPGNQLLFADLTLVNGHEALDFFIRTGNVYFKGRAMMIKNSLYLMAMECEVQNYDEKPYNAFVESFDLKK